MCPARISDKVVIHSRHGRSCSLTTRSSNTERVSSTIVAVCLERNSWTLPFPVRRELDDRSHIPCFVSHLLATRPLNTQRCSNQSPYTPPIHTSRAFLSTNWAQEQVAPTRKHQQQLRGSLQRRKLSVVQTILHSRMCCSSFHVIPDLSHGGAELTGEDLLVRQKIPLACV